MTTFDRQDKILDSRQLLVAMVDIVKSRGVHPDKLLTGTALFYQDLQKVNHKVSAQDVFQVISNCDKLLKQQDLSFLLGSKYIHSSLNELSAVVMNSHNFANLLKIAQSFQFQLFPLMFFSVRHYQDKTYLIFNHAFGGVNKQQEQFLLELVFTAVSSLLKFRFGYMPQLSYQLPYAEPQHIEQYHVYLGNAVSFAQPLAMISFPRNVLQQPFYQASRSLSKLHRKQLFSERRIKKKSGFIQAVHEVMLSAIKNGQTMSLELCASIFGISSATFKRKLKLQQTSYQQLFDKVRSQQAIFQISQCQQSNELVAQTLQFNDMTNFRRSFKRWTGMTPSDLRLKNNK